MDVEAFVVDGPKEALDLAVGLRRIGADHVVANRQCLADLLESGEAIGMVRMAHGERERVVRQHRFDPVRQRRDDVLQEGRGRDTGLVRLNPDDCLPAEVIYGRELEVMPALRRAGRYFRSMCSSSPGRLFS